MSHTPGPWIVGCCVNGSFEIVAPPDRLFICGRAAYENQAKEMQANARLIAAAPDLLEALESLLGAVETMKCPQNIDDVAMLVIRFSSRIDQSRAAIAKARGA